MPAGSSTHERKRQERNNEMKKWEELVEVMASHGFDPRFFSNLKPKPLMQFAHVGETRVAEKRSIQSTPLREEYFRLLREN